MYICFVRYTNSYQEAVIEAKYSIQLVSKLSGIGVHTIRAWEKRYNALTPNRSQTGRREYNDTDLEKLVFLSQLCTLGHSIGKIANLPSSELKTMLDKFAKTSRTEIQIKDGNDFNLQSTIDNMLLAITMYKLEIIDHELSKIKLLVSTKDLIFKVLLPLLSKVGELIQKRQLTISGELAFYAILKFHLGEVIYKSRRKNQGLEKILVAAPEGTFDEVPLLLVSILLISKNFEVIYLGNNSPAGALLEISQATGANNVMLFLGRVNEEDTVNFHKKYLDFLIKKSPASLKIFALKSKNIDFKNPYQDRLSLYENLGQIDQLMKF